MLFSLGLLHATYLNIIRYVFIAVIILMQHIQ
jgi:hypothetical protein